VHVGLDESFHLGKCPRCRADIERRGLAAHFAGHVNQLGRLTTGRGLRLGLWADMLALLPAAIPLLPRGVIAYDWYYYPFARHPRIELRNFAEVDLATPLQAHGIEYWGCPMNGAFRYEPLPVFGERLANILSWWKRCRRVGAAGFLVTSWEANRLAIELTTAIDAAAACLWLDPGVEDPREMLARGFARVFGSTKVGRVSEVAQPLRCSALPDAARRRGDKPPHPSEIRRWARAALACDEHAFAGYHRWQINDRWDVCAGREGLAHYEREARALERLCRSLLARSTGSSVRQTQDDPERESNGSGPRACRGAGDARVGQVFAPGEGVMVRAQACPFDKLRAPSRSRGCARRRGRDKIAPLPSPPALAASMAFRLYLARRDVFVRRATQAVFQLRRVLANNLAAGAERAEAPLGEQVAASASERTVHAQSPAGARGHIVRLHAEATAFAAAIRAGRAAARAMWRRSRSSHVRGPNELMLDRDAERLREWTRWLRKAVRCPELVRQATPVCGAWQLQFTVHNFAPALQRVVVEQRQPDGAWKAIHGVYTIEFRAAAAKPRTGIRREYSVPISVAASVSEWRLSDRPLAGARRHAIQPSPLAGARSYSILPPSAPNGAGRRAATLGFPPLRLAVHGVGQVGISNVSLTNGVATFQPRGWPSTGKRILGRAAPTRGFPKIPDKRPSSVRLAFL
jgi:hypothetical protein